MGGGRDYYRVERQPGYTRALVALYRFYPEHPVGSPERGPFAYRWIPVEDDAEEERFLTKLCDDGFKELPAGEMDATPRS